MNSSFDETGELDFYRRLVRLYPASFREQFGAEQLVVIRDMLRERKEGSSLRTRAASFGDILVDLMWSIIAEHLSLWRNTMKASKIVKLAGLLALLAWILYFGMSLSHPLWGFPKKDPASLLLGQNYSGLAVTLLDLAVYLIPLLAFLAFLIPAVKVRFSPGANETLVIRLQKLGKLEAAVALVSLLITLAWWGIILLSRFNLI